MFIHAAFRLLGDGHKNVRFLIVGDGELKNELTGIAENLTTISGTEQFQNKIIFTSWIKEVDEVLAASDIVALTSWNEGTPVSLIEAHASSCPVVTTRAGGVEDIVMHGQTGFVCDPGDTETFTAHLKNLINNPELRLSMASVARDRVLKQYSYQRLVDDMSRLYARLLSQKA
jgi:glycosyltransferase involved in cell wall biosynthesis